MAESRGFPAIALALLAAPPLGGCDATRARVNDLGVTAALLPVTTVVRAPDAVTRSAISVPEVRIGPASAGGCPVEMVRVLDSCVDRFEATLVEVSGDRELSHPSYEQPKSGVRYEARSAGGVSPQAYVSRETAGEACRNAGKRLCSVDEWYEACRGRQGFRYPYGSELVRDRCNTNKEHLLARFFGRNPRHWSYANFNDSRLSREPGFLSATAEHSECKSDYGTYDMVGNLHEWVEDRVDHALEKKIPLVDGVRKAIRRNIGNGIFMGGFYSTDGQQGEGCGYVTLAHGTKYHDYSTGFRCCADANADR